jgi:hypothetical protein
LTSRREGLNNELGAILKKREETIKQTAAAAQVGDTEKETELDVALEALTSKERVLREKIDAFKNAKTYLDDEKFSELISSYRENYLDNLSRKQYHAMLFGLIEHWKLAISSIEGQMPDNSKIGSVGIYETSKTVDILFNHKSIDITGHKAGVDELAKIRFLNAYATKTCDRAFDGTPAAEILRIQAGVDYDK